MRQNTLALLFFMAAFFPLKEAEANIQPVVVQNFLEEAKKNQNWKVAFVTGDDEQIVFMNVSPRTAPQNEIGREVHDFDQVILIVEGKGKAVLNGKAAQVKEGDMIFIPQGTPHNVINLGKDKPLKLISFYSDTDIPADSVFPRKEDEIDHLGSES